jgi:hypothetical protein
MRLNIAVGAVRNRFLVPAEQIRPATAAEARGLFSSPCPVKHGVRSLGTQQCLSAAEPTMSLSTLSCVKDLFPTAIKNQCRVVWFG